jgi:hypothetical protein
LNKQDIINKLGDKPYPRSEYWIVAGAGLVMHGVKAETRDIDIGCSALLANLLIQNGAKWQIYEDGTRQISEDSDIELFENWGGDEIVEIDGFCVASLESIRKLKVELNRPKDLDDIILIDKFLNLGTNMEC